MRPRTAHVASTPDQSSLRAATRAVYVAFAGAGFGFASWASRIPQVRSHLQIDPGTLGLLLLCIAAGSMIALPMAGALVNRLHESRTVSAAVLTLCVGLVTVGIGYRYAIAPVACGLFLFGVGMGVWDVAMNVQGAWVERQLGRSIMSRFHAGFSIGTVAGGAVGALMIALNVSVTVHLLSVAVLIAATVPLRTRRFLSSYSSQTGWPESSSAGIDDLRPAGPLAAWREPRTLLIGIVVLCAGFAEGTGNDWLSLAVIDGYHARVVLGTITFALFLVAMTTGRWFGPAALDRYGRVAVLRASAMVALFGLLLVVFATALPVAMAGAVLWGLGTALGFPTGMSAATDDPRHAASRLSAVASIGYVAFLAGPPLVGLIGNHVGVLRSLLVAAGLMGIGAAVASATRQGAP